MIVFSKVESKTQKTFQSIFNEKNKWPLRNYQFNRDSGKWKRLKCDEVFSSILIIHI